MKQCKQKTALLEVGRGNEHGVMREAEPVRLILELSNRRYRRETFERLQAVYGTQTRAANPLYASK